MDILIIGDGAGEHAIAWKLAESRKTGTIYCNSENSGILTLCEKINASPDEWIKSHSPGLVINNNKFIETIVDYKPGTIHINCFTDGHILIPMQAIHLHYINGEIAAAAAPAMEYTEDMARTAFDKIFMPKVKEYNKLGINLHGIICFELDISSGKPQLTTFKQGFDGIDAAVLLPLLKSELAPILIACKNGDLDRTAVRFNGNCSYVVILSAERAGEHIEGIKNVPMNIGIFMNSVKFLNRKLQTFGRHTLYICARGQNAENTREEACLAAASINYKGIIRYNIE